MSPSRPVVGALLVLSLAACNTSPPPPDPSPAVPIGTARSAQLGPPVCIAVPGADVMLLESSPDTNESGLSGSTFFTGTSKGGSRGYTLMRFDLSAVPSDAQVTSATVTVTPNAARGIGTVNVHHVLAGWSAATVTWNSFVAGFDPSPAASFPSGLAPYSAPAVTSGLSPVSFDLESLVQAWVSGVAPNDGVLLEQSLVETGPSYTYYDDGAVGGPSLALCYQETGQINPCLGVTCTASDACHAAGVCDPATGLCSNPTQPDGTACNDGNACTQTDACHGGVCTGSSPVVCTASDACHTAGVCDPATGACSNPAQPDGTTCDDGNACTQIDACQSGVCTGSSPVVCTASDACHAAGVCDPATGACSNPAQADGTACDDGNACTQTDTCQAGVCTGSNLVICTAPDACHTAGACDPATGACSSAALSDGSPCPGGTCQGGACQTTASCSDGIQNQGEQGVDCGGPCPPCGLCLSTLGTPDTSGFGFLGYMAYDAEGDLFVADQDNNQIHELTPDGQVVTFGSGVYGYADGPSASAAFAFPIAVAVDPLGDVYVADADNAVIRLITPDGNVSTVAGTPGVYGHLDGPAASAEMLFPSDLQLDAQGNLYFIDYSDSTVRVLDTSGNVTTVAGTPGVFDHADGPAASALFAGLSGMTIDAQGNLYLTEWDGADIRELDTSGNVTTIAGTPGVQGAVDGPAASAQFSGLDDIVIDAQGDLLVVDDLAATIREVTPGGVVSTIAGSAFQHGVVDGCAAHEPLDNPSGIAIAPDGTLHITDDASLRTIGAGTCDCSGATCFDGVQNQGEEGVDCGGPCDLACPTCTDGIKNGGELDADCGGPCPLCGPGAACTVDGSCASAACRGGQCQPPTCLDGVQNQGEVDVDCGGPCPLCAAGTPCTVGAGCVSQVCSGGACTEASCTDGIQNQGEVDVDCGGPCALCEAGTACTQGTACASGVCSGGFCQEPTCFDGVQNGGEIDADCGGACGPCPVGEHCITGGDCATGVCQGNVCRPSTCGDGSRDGGESDVDCGGPCVGCAAGRACGSAADCIANRCVSGICNPPLVPPALDPTVATDVASSTAFLYSGANAVQIGVAPAAIDTRRVGVVRGHVIDRSGAPISDVALRVLGHPELGLTYTRADGAFDVAVNGGGPVTFVYDKQGLISAQREIVVPWLDFVAAPDVVMIGLDASVTTVDLTNEDTTQVARGSLVVDHDGARQATAMFAPGTTADMLLPDGSRRRLTSISVRASEFTVGAHGLQTMPAALPPASGYTYAVDMSSDQAVLAGAKQLVFSQPVPVYVDNFLSFPVGQVVPVGYYDPDQGAWVASQNGVVLKVLSVTGGLADLDVDGTGAAASAATLATLGITDGERAQLASLYAPGATLWRGPLSHFSLIDMNWPYGFPPGAGPPPTPNNPPPKSDCDHGASGSIINCESQVLGEELPVAGTGMKLMYSTRGLATRAIDFTISGPTVPASLKRIDLLLSVAGESQTISFPPQPNQTYHYVWDGKDGYGRAVTGTVQPTANLHYVYPMTYYSAPSAYYASFAQFPGVSFQSSQIYGGELVYTGDLIGGRDWPGESANEIFSNEPYPTPPLQGSDEELGLGGWSLDVHKGYQPQSPQGQSVLDVPHKILRIPSVIQTAAGGGTADPGAGGRALDAAVSYPGGVAVASDGSFYFVDEGRIFQVTPDGLIHLTAGCDGDPMHCDGTWVQGGGYGEELASVGGGGGEDNLFFQPNSAMSCTPTAPSKCVATRVSLPFPTDVAVGFHGSVYVADEAGAIYRIDPDGTLVVVAGGIGGGFSGDGGPALAANMNPAALAVGPDGAIYFADSFNARVRRVGPEGVITTIAGTGSFGNDGDGGAAVTASIGEPIGIALAPDGTLYIASFQSVGFFNQTGWIRRVGADGLIFTVAGDGRPVNYQDRTDFNASPATSVTVFPNRVAVTKDGVVYFDTHGRVYRVQTDGTLLRVAGTGGSSDTGDGGLAVDASLSDVRGLALGPDGTLFLSAQAGIRTVAPFAPILAPAPPSWRVLTDVALYPVGDVVYAFDGLGRHVRTVKRVGEQAVNTFTYDANGRLSAVGGPYGEQTVIERDANGTATAIVAPGGERTALAVGVDGRLAALTTPAGDTARMTYASSGLLTQLTDLRGGLHVFTYDTSSRLVKDQGPSGAFTTLARTDLPDGYDVVTTTALGRTKHYRVEDLTDGSRVRTVVDERGGITQIATAADGATTITQPDGTTVSTTLAPDPVVGMVAPYDATQVITTPDGTVSNLTRTITAVGAIDPLNASRVETISSNGETWTQAWDGDARTFTVLTPSSQSVAQYDANGRVLGVVRSDLSTGEQQTTTRTYEASGFLVSLASPAGSWTFTHDAGFRVSSRTDALGHTSTIAYDADGRPATLMEPSGEVTTIQYDPEARVLSRTVGGGTTSYAYDAMGNFTSKVEADGSRATFTYDIDGRQTAKVDSAGGSVAYTLDAAGNRTREDTYDAGGMLRSTIVRTFDARNRVTRTTTGAGQVTTYGYAAGEQSTITDGLGNQITYTYDANDVLTQLTDGAGETTNYAYDDTTNLQTVTDARGASTLLQYDTFGNYLATASPDTGATTLTHDANGLVTSRTDGRGVTTTYTHDAAQRPTSIAYSTGAPGVTFTYDEGPFGAGMLTGIAEGTGTTHYGYDAQGHVVEEDRTLGGQTWSITRTYNSGGWVTSLALAPGGATITYAYDANGRVAQITASDGQTSRTLVSGVTYLPFGPLSGMTLGNGVAVSKTYDAANRLTRLVAGAALDRSYAYDAAGNLVGIADALAPGRSETFAYDGAARLTRATGAYGVEAYTYDGVGDRLSIARDGATDTYSYGSTSQQLLGVTGDTNEGYAYDASGNPTTVGGLALTYDENSHLASASAGGQLLATYESSVMGHRVRKTDAAGNVTVYLFDGFSLLATADGNGNVIEQHVYLGGMRVAVLHGGRVDDADVSYVVNDHRSAPVMLLDQAGQVAWAGTYRPFGEVDVTTSVVSNDFRLPGQVVDAETGLYDNHLRTYDPRTGRFLQSDPSGLAGGTATYVYATASPILFVDPLALGKIGISGYDGPGGGISISWGKDGFSVCAEVGFGEGVDASYSPNAKADESKVYTEASYKMTAGPASEEFKIGAETSPCGAGANVTASGTISYGPGSVEVSGSAPVENLTHWDTDVDPSVSLNPADWKTSTEVGAEAKVSVGVCHRF